MAGHPRPPRDWHGRTVNYPLALAVLACHGLTALAWQPMERAPVPERILSAVLLPPVNAQRAREQPEPPMAAPRPRAKQELSSPSQPRAEAEWSEQEIPEMPETSGEPAPEPATGGLRGAPASRAPDFHTPTAALSQTSVPIPVAGNAPSPGALSRPGAAGRRPAQGALAGASLAAPAEAAAGTAPVPRSEVGGSLSHVRPVMTTSGTAGTRSVAAMAPGVPGGHGGTAAPPSPADVADRVALARTDPAIAVSVAPSARGPATLSDAKAPLVQAAPAEASSVRLARARPGRPVPLTGEGSNEIVDYAEDNPEFVYPRFAVRMGLEGTVVLEVEVLPDGRPGHVRLKESSGSELLDKDAMRQMSTWKFKPAQRMGRTYATRVTVPVNYRLNGKGKP